jgi:hypothetical protein
MKRIKAVMKRRKLSANEAVKLSEELPVDSNKFNSPEDVRCKAKSSY